MEIPASVYRLESDNTGTGVVLPHVLNVTSCLDYIESQSGVRRAPVVRIQSTGDPVVITCDSLEQARALADELYEALESWHQYAAIGPFAWAQITGAALEEID